MLTLVVLLIASNLASLVAFAMLWRTTRQPRDPRQVLAGGNTTIPTYSESLPQIMAEVSRARRFYHRLSVVVFRLGNMASEAVSTSEARQMQELRFLFLGSLLREELRIFDIVTYDAARDQYVVLLVESNRRQAEGLVKRIANMVHDRAGLTLVAGVSEFPYAGLIIEDLVSKAGETCTVATNGASEAAAG